MFGHHDTRIYIIESDIYARQAIASYLSWDRRTRVVGSVSSPYEMIADIRENEDLKRIDVVVLDANLAAAPAGLAALIRLISHHAPEASVICLAHSIPPETVTSVRKAGARALLSREQVGIGLASAVYFSLWHQFVITQDLAVLVEQSGEWINPPITILPERRTYSRLTQRIEQAIWLCVVEGLPAERAAEEMGVSTSTIRSYIKEGYRILEADDDTIYPPSISPAERAFLRYSALEFSGIDLRDEPAA